MLISQDTARRILGEALLLRVQPAAITRYCGDGRPLTASLERALRLQKWSSVLPSIAAAAHPMIIPTRLFPSEAPIDHAAKYMRVRELIRAEGDWRSTSFYQDWIVELVLNGTIRRKKQDIQTIEQLDRFIEQYMVGLIRSIRENGFRQELGKDGPTGMINSKGAIVQSWKGRHRFAAARELGISEIPIEIIGIDRTWIRSIGGGFRDSRRRRALIVGLRQVESAHRLSPGGLDSAISL